MMLGSRNGCSVFCEENMVTAGGRHVSGDDNDRRDIAHLVFSIVCYDHLTQSRPDRLLAENETYETEAYSKM